MGSGLDSTQAMRPQTLRGATHGDAHAAGPTNVGVSWGDYVIYERLGAGGMAVVHRAERRAGGTRQRVALKRLLPHAAGDPELVDLFVREANVVSRMHHRHIAQIHEVGRNGDEYFLAMELVAGPSLNDLLRCSSTTVGQIPFPITLKILSEICDALSYVHAQKDDAGRSLGLVHRDISPSNAVISSNGVVKLIDFGIAKTSTTTTQVGVIKGKIGYVAPEYIEGTLDHRADLWGVGVVAWELLTGRRLFKGDDDLATLQLVRSLPIDPPSFHNPEVPPELDAIVMTMLHRDPAMRWQNATALRTALLGVARPSSNSEIVEWVDWVFSMFGRGERPLRGSRPLQPQKAQRFVVAMPSEAVGPAMTPMLFSAGLRASSSMHGALPRPLQGTPALWRRESATVRVSALSRGPTTAQLAWIAVAWIVVAVISAVLVTTLRPEWIAQILYWLD